MEWDSRSTRREFVAAGVGAGALAVAGCTEPDPDPGDDLEIHHLDVDQADATVIVTPADETIVVDTGDWWQDGEPVIDYLELLGIEHIEHLVATHAHSDHLGGHADLIEHFETERDGIGFIYDSGLSHGSQTYESYLDAVETYGHELLLVEEGEALPVDGLDVFCLNPPTGNSGDDLHYNCVVLHVEHGDVGYLTTGDAEDDAESRMRASWGSQLSADIYQAGHHGSSTSSTDSFVDEVDPAMGVISSGYDNQYDHPADQVLLTFDTFDVETYWTGVHADTTMTVDGTSISTETGEIFSTDPLDILEATPDSDVDALIPIAVDGDGETTLFVDRIEAGVAVLLSESEGAVTGQSVVPANRLPEEASEGTVLSVTVEQGAIREIAVDAATTQQRRQRAAERLAGLSTPLSAVQ